MAACEIQPSSFLRKSEQLKYTYTFMPWRLDTEKSKALLAVIEKKRAKNITELAALEVGRLRVY